MKLKIIFLGGSNFQSFAYLKAKKMGHETICIDYLKNSPGHKLANYSFVENSTDKNKVLNIAKKLNVSAIIPYASDPSAFTANLVSKKLKLKHNNLKSIKILTNKYLFRKFQKKLRFNCPKFILFTSSQKLKKFFLDNHNLVVVKPVDSSGSKGVTIVKNEKNLIPSVKKALKFSRLKKVIVEEYIYKDGFQIAGDAFIYNSRIINLSLANEHFSKNGYPIPIGESFPYNDIYNIKHKLKKELIKILLALNFNFGPINLDIRIKNKKIFIMEIGPRSGGNLIPQAIKYHCDFDQLESMINGYLKKKIKFKNSKITKFCSTYIVHSDKSGYLKKIFKNPKIKNNILKIYLWKKRGEFINSFNNSGDTIGACILKFKSMNEMLKKMEIMSELIKVKI